ncbi:MAG: SDR family oxidoreductase [Deltaproteobacteria bacterium]|nr:MAG: SDR family oxidoreductase [Deltaproteobacteria bacterium]
MTATSSTPNRPTVLITGATSGIGRATALRLARTGFRVFATGRNAEALAALEREADGGPLTAFRLDVTDPESVAAAVRTVDAATGGYGLDALVNNAGYGTAGPAELCTDDDIRAQYEVNLFGALRVTRAFLPKMRERGAGRVVNVSSIGGRITFPLFGVYNSTKYALESLTDALRMELHPFGVRFVLVEPGVIATGFADRSMHEVAKYRSADSPYAPVTDRADELRAKTDRTAVGPEVIARTIERALRARRPRARYVAPFRYRVALALIAITPTWLYDWAMRRAVGLTRRNLGLAGGPRPALRPGPAAR